MKALFTIIAMSFALTVPAYAVEAHHPDTQKASAAAKVQPVSKKTALPAMRSNLKKMNAQLKRMEKAKNDDELRALMAEHMQTMRDSMMYNMQLMNSTGCPMMGDGMGMMGSAGMMGGFGMSGANSGMMQRMDMMEKRMDMMQKRMGEMGK